MIFNFLTYLKPIWYFNLNPHKDWCYFPSHHQLKKASFDLVEDSGYFSVLSKERDLAWAAFQSGFISTNGDSGIHIWEHISLPVEDEYRFLRKNFHRGWVLYVLIIRLFTFHNPFKELRGYWKNRHVKRIEYSPKVVAGQILSNFKSSLLLESPFISVVIPTLNRYDYLHDVLIDLENQNYKNFEVIIVDQSNPYRLDFYKGWNLNIRHWFQQERALWKARNEAIQSSDAAWILLYDDDSRVEPDWIENHLKAIDYFQADISSGVSLSVIGDTIPKHYSYFRWSDQLDTGNVLLKKSIFENIGYFDLHFEKERMGDGEFGLRSYLNGYKNISNPLAKRIHLKVKDGGLREMGSWDGWRPKNVFGPRPVPSVLYLSRKYFGNRLTLFYLLRSIIPSYVPYRWKANKFLILLSVFLFPIFLPLILFQVVKSWRLSNKKLRSKVKAK